MSINRTQTEEHICERVVLPVGSKQDARATVDAVLPHLHNYTHIVVVHVTEPEVKGNPRANAGIDYGKKYARDVLSIVENRLSSEGIRVETKVLFGYDVHGEITDFADRIDASSIVFCPRGSGLLRRFFSGNVGRKLVDASEIPVVVVPRIEMENSGTEPNTNDSKNPL